MNIIIVGCGRVGITLAEKLNNDGNKITLIDLNASKLKSVVNRIDVMGVIGNGATHTVQREAGIETADLFIAVTDSDELNLLCCIVAKKEGNCQTIARLKNPEYSVDAPYLKEQLGLAMVINPEYAAAEEIARVLSFPSALKIEPFGKGKVDLIKFKLPANCKLVGMAVKDVIAKFHTDVLICTIEREDEAYIAKGDSVFEEKDIVSIVASHKQAIEFFKKINYVSQSIKSAMIAGGGIIAHYLCKILERSNIALKIIEKDLSVCEELSNRWEKLNVIHGNALDKDLLLEEGIEHTHAFVALAPHDEENILLSLFCKEVSAGKLVTEIKRTDYDNVIAKLDLDTVICPKNITADIIVRYVRATKNAQGSNVETLYNIIDGKVEACEFIVKAASPVINKPLSELQFKDGVLIASILRGDTVIIPRGHDIIQEGDRVVVATTNLGLQDFTDVLR